MNFEQTVQELAGKTFGKTRFVETVFKQLMPRLQEFYGQDDQFGFMKLVWMNFSGGGTCEMFTQEVWERMSLDRV